MLLLLLMQKKKKKKKKMKMKKTHPPPAEEYSIPHYYHHHLPFVYLYICNKQSNSSTQEFCKADPFLFLAFFFGSWVIVFLETGSSFL